MPVARRRLAAIMFTDMVGYSALAQRNEAAALKLLDRHNRLLRPVFARFAGREVKTVGDAFLVEFESALDAVRAAIEVQRELDKYDRSAAEGLEIRVRIGVHVGDVVQQGDDVLGDAVNIASRIQPLASPGGICLTQQVVDQVQTKIAERLERLPPTPLKNLRGPVAVYRVVLPWEAPAAGSGAAPGSGRQLAVLPLANISPDPNDGYFADGLTEELISVLSQVDGLSVIARTSVMPYKAAPKSVPQIGSELGVDSVLEGSVRKAGDRMRITLQLIDVPTQRHVWASSYDRELHDVFAVQTDIADRTAEALRLRLGTTAPEGGRRRPTDNLAAYDLYLRGLVAAQERDDGYLETAVRWFSEATKLDPKFAEAYAAWATTYVIAAGEHVAMREAIPKARRLAARALRLDPNSSDAHAALANIAFQYDHRWRYAEAEFRRAIELNPSNVTATQFFGTMLFALGRFEEAKELTRRAIRLNPGGGPSALLAWIEYESGDPAEAIRQAEEGRDREPGAAQGHSYLGLLYLGAGRRGDARREADFRLVRPTEEERFDHALLNALVGRTAEARAIARRIEQGTEPGYNSATHLAMLYSALGEKRRALSLLEKDYRAGDRVLWLWQRGIYFDPIRADPRFVRLLHRYGLPAEPPRRPLLAERPRRRVPRRGTRRRR